MIREICSLCHYELLIVSALVDRIGRGSVGSVETQQNMSDTGRG